ncbi:cyclic nucleotide-binding domain-containing protein [bacterium SCSIO 12827]|nr:cyclic nucleotide-binding domain-containing protein [bacterium SCSIO 12827]
MQTNLAGKTYEVQTESDGKWTFFASHNVKSQAIQQAQALLDSHKYSGVKVIAESDRKGDEIIFNERAEVTDKGLTVVPIDSSPVCETLSDCYQLEARRTIGRLLRQYLDDVGMTAMELAFDFGRLKMLERDDKLYIGALSRLASLQVDKDAGEKPVDRQNKLERLYNQLVANAQKMMKREDLNEALQAGGLQALIDKVNAEAPADERHMLILAGLAVHLGEQGDWSGKIESLVTLLGGQAGVVVQAYVDEALAEILDGTAAITELLGGVADAASAHRMLVQLCQGRLPEVKNPLSCINELNKTMAAYELENARDAILGRVARGIGGVKPMTREGKEGERTALVTLIRNLEGYAGLLGGPQMAEALTLRAKMALGREDGDLSAEEAVASILAYLPSLPSRAGFVLDLSATDTGAKQQAAVVRNLAQAMRGLTGVDALTGGGQDAKMAKRVADVLKEKIAAAGLPNELKRTAAATLDKALANGAAAGGAPNGAAPQEKRWDEGAQKPAQPAPAAAPKPAPAPAPAAAPANGGGKGPEQRKLVKGQILFEEGDAGTEAFLISTGAIEIYRRGAIEQSLATLGAGELLGELSLIDDQPRAASARAAEDSVLIVLSKESLKARLQRLEQTDKVLHRLMGVLVNRLRGMARSAE